MNKILDMTRLESSPVQLDRQWYPLETLMLGALSRVCGCIEGHIVTPTLPNDLLRVYVDAVAVEKLLTNLLENAAKYSGANTHIAIAASTCEHAIEIRVSDEGCGFPPGDPDAVFRKFHRGKHRSDLPGNWSRPICRAIAALHGGTIRAERRPTAGTTFVVTLPIVPGAPAPADWAVTSASC